MCCAGPDRRRSAAPGRALLLRWRASPMLVELATAAAGVGGSRPVGLRINES